MIQIMQVCDRRPVGSRPCRQTPSSRPRADAVGGGGLAGGPVRLPPLPGPPFPRRAPCRAARPPPPGPAGGVFFPPLRRPNPLRYLNFPTTPGGGFWALGGPAVAGGRPPGGSFGLPPPFPPATPLAPSPLKSGGAPQILGRGKGGGNPPKTSSPPRGGRGGDRGEYGRRLSGVLGFRGFSRSSLNRPVPQFRRSGLADGRARDQMPEVDCVPVDHLDGGSRSHSPSQAISIRTPIRFPRGTHRGYLTVPPFAQKPQPGPSQSRPLG